MAMTLEKVAESLRSISKAHGNAFFNEMADAIDAHLTQPAQAVDVAALRELREEMVGTHSLVTGRGIDRWIAALDNALPTSPTPDKEG